MPPPGTSPGMGPGAGGGGYGPRYPQGDTPDIPKGNWPPPGAEVPPVTPPGRWSDVVKPPGGFPPNPTPATPRGGPIDPAAIRAALAAKLAASGAGAPLSTPDPLQAALMKLKLGGGL